MTTIRYLITGRVQGVGFRYAALNTAHSLGIRGTVRNRMDGSVEVVAQAENNRLEAFELFLHEGPSWSRVTEVQRVAIDTTQEYPDFRILYR